MKRILQYNWRVYARTSTGITAVCIIAAALPAPWRSLILIGAAPALWWLVASLVASSYIYDRAPLYSLRWLDGCLSRRAQRWVNIHAGLDDTSHRLAAVFPSIELRILDIHDPCEMTEPSIAEARRVTGAQVASTPADWRALPFADRTFDAAFLIFVAHELRRNNARVQLFREVARILRAGGELVLVEHLRDWINFLAFGPGFLHFFSERSWRRAADRAGLRVDRHLSVTPFVKVFVLRSAS